MRVTAEVERRSSQKAMGSGVFLRQVAGEGAGGLDAGAFGAIHVERQAEDDGGDLVFSDEVQDAFGILGELGPLDGFERAG